MFTKNHELSLDLIFPKKTNVSDVYLLVPTFMRAKTSGLKPKHINYRDFKKLNKSAFCQKLKLQLSNGLTGFYLHVVKSFNSSHYYCYLSLLSLF